MSAVVVASRSRDVVVGRHSQVWQRVRQHLDHCHVVVELSHAEIAGFDFSRDDCVWLFAYSRHEKENETMIRQLAGAGVREIVYVSSASAVVALHTRCYAYPRVKLAAERIVASLPNGRVISLGLVYESPDELPGGSHIATSVGSISDFIKQPKWPDGHEPRLLLGGRVVRPFCGSFEQFAYRAYDRLMRIFGRVPCVLRPIDALLRAVGYRWYGYVYLSNKLWTTTTS